MFNLPMDPNDNHPGGVREDLKMFEVETRGSQGTVR